MYCNADYQSIFCEISLSIGFSLLRNLLVQYMSMLLRVINFQIRVRDIKGGSGRRNKLVALNIVCPNRMPWKTQDSEIMKGQKIVLFNSARGGGAQLDNLNWVSLLNGWALLMLFGYYSHRNVLKVFCGRGNRFFPQDENHININCKAGILIIWFMTVHTPLNTSQINIYV